MEDAGEHSKRVGVIGLGLMGVAICERLLDDGYAPVVFNRSADKAAPLVARGARWSDNPLAECRRVIISLYTTDVVEAVLEQLDAGLRPGTILIDTTTGEPSRMSPLGRRLAERGVTYIEAPISGSSEQTRRRQATALVAGPADAIAQCDDLLRSIAARYYHVGEWGDAIRMKLVTNLVLGLNRAALAEGLVFAKTIGLQLPAVLEVLLDTPAYSRTMDAKGPKMIGEDFAPQAKLSQHLKDVRIILEEAQRGGMMLPLSTLHSELMEAAETAGWGDLDNSVIIRSIEQAASNRSTKSTS
jgi:3-hydroxyisobutyrate dehydrogenase-like beta-hydroxyacid dehydrogenase